MFQVQWQHPDGSWVAAFATDGHKTSTQADAVGPWPDGVPNTSTRNCFKLRKDARAFHAARKDAYVLAGQKHRLRIVNLNPTERNMQAGAEYVVQYKHDGHMPAWTADPTHGGPYTTRKAAREALARAKASDTPRFWKFRIMQVWRT